MIAPFELVNVILNELINLLSLGPNFQKHRRHLLKTCKQIEMNESKKNSDLCSRQQTLIYANIRVHL